jgi:hypothetical protein
MRTALAKLAVGVCAIVAMFATPATAQSKGDQAKGACRPEPMDACVARQLKIRDPISGVSIQRGDAERFCSRKSQRC